MLILLNLLDDAARRIDALDIVGHVCAGPRRRLEVIGVVLLQKFHWRPLLTEYGIGCIVVVVGHGRASLEGRRRGRAMVLGVLVGHGRAGTGRDVVPCNIGLAPFATAVAALLAGEGCFHVSGLDQVLRRLARLHAYDTARSASTMASIRLHGTIAHGFGFVFETGGNAAAVDRIGPRGDAACARRWKDTVREEIEEGVKGADEAVRRAFPDDVLGSGIVYVLDDDVDDDAAALPAKPVAQIGRHGEDGSSAGDGGRWPREPREEAEGMARRLQGRKKPGRLERKKESTKAGSG